MKKILFILLSFLLLGCSKGDGVVTDDEVSALGGTHQYNGEKYIVTLDVAGGKSSFSLEASSGWPIAIFDAKSKEVLFSQDKGIYQFVFEEYKDGVYESGVGWGYDSFKLQIVPKSETSFVAYPRENTSEFALPDKMMFKLGASK